MTKYPRLSRPRAPLALDVPLQLEAHLQLQGKTHRVGPDFGSTLTVSSRDYQSKCWVNWKSMGQPCEFQVCARRTALRHTHAHTRTSAHQHAYGHTQRDTHRTAAQTHKHTRKHTTHT
jgi:hypothetical protein